MTDCKVIIKHSSANYFGEHGTSQLDWISYEHELIGFCPLLRYPWSTLVHHGLLGVDVPLWFERFIFYVTCRTISFRGTGGSNPTLSESQRDRYSLSPWTPLVIIRLHSFRPSHLVGLRTSDLSYTPCQGLDFLLIEAFQDFISKPSRVFWVA